MKSLDLKYNIELNLEKNEQVLLKVITHISNEKLQKKLLMLLKDILVIKNKLYKIIYNEDNSKSIDRSVIQKKYEDYKNIMSFL